MTNHQTIEIVDSWSLRSGIIAELKHQLNGLKSGSILKSDTTDREWRVKKRILFHHAIDGQKKFANEETLFTHGSFGSVENMISSSKNILDKEEQGIFLYQLEPIEHNLKPAVGDTFVIVTSTT